jgi:hypothetical protein
MMASPFPGMDPYLEHPAIFPGLHDSMITYLREALQARLPEPYYAEIGERVWVEMSQRPIGPDVNVLRARETPAFEESSSRGVAMASTTRSKRVVVTVPHDEYREPCLEIFAMLEGERLVTTIEVLSLTNKTPGAHGRALYLRKQREVLRSQIHLVEIDLLRAGEHTTAVPRDLAVARAGPFEYHVCIHHFDNLEEYFVYPIRLPEPLPEIHIPLLPDEPAIAIDLQEVFQRCYDTGPYRRRIDYHHTAPQPALGPQYTQWAAQRLQ